MLLHWSEHSFRTLQLIALSKTSVSSWRERKINLKYTLGKSCFKSLRKSLAATAKKRKNKVTPNRVCRKKTHLFSHVQTLFHSLRKCKSVYPSPRLRYKYLQCGFYFRLLPFWKKGCGKTSHRNLSSSSQRRKKIMLCHEVVLVGSEDNKRVRGWPVDLREGLRPETPPDQGCLALVAWWHRGCAGGSSAQYLHCSQSGNRETGWGSRLSFRRPRKKKAHLSEKGEDITCREREKNNRKANKRNGIFVFKEPYSYLHTMPYRCAVKI